MTVLDDLPEQDWRDAVRDAATYPVQKPDTKVRTLTERRDAEAA